MRIANRPTFYVILLLIIVMAALTVYLMWKLPEAEELSRAKKNAVPASLPAYQP